MAGRQVLNVLPSLPPFCWKPEIFHPKLLAKKPPCSSEGRRSPAGLGSCFPDALSTRRGLPGTLSGQGSKLKRLRGDQAVRIGEV